MTEALRDDDTRSDERDGVDEERVADADAGREGPGLPPPSAVESLVQALLDAGPDVAAHVVRAAQELLAAAQVIVDAAQYAVAEQQAVRADADAASPDAGAPDTTSPDPGGDPAADDSRIRHLDLAE